MTAPRITFEEVPIGDGKGVEFPETADYYNEVEVYKEEGTVLVAFEHHPDDTDERREVA